MLYSVRRISVQASREFNRFDENRSLVDLVKYMYECKCPWRDPNIDILSTCETISGYFIHTSES